jgi:hypothetical protein
MVVNVTIPAVRRLELLKKTIESFHRNMFAPAEKNGIEFVPYINIDPVGPDDAKDLIEFMKTVFPVTHFRIPETCNFGSAVKWLWESCGPCDYVLHLEDDWQLLKPIDIRDVISILASDEKLAALRFSAWPANEKALLIAGRADVAFTWNGSYFICPPGIKRPHGVCGNPSVFKYEFVRQAAKLIDPNLNPEKQWAQGNQPLADFMLEWEYGAYGRPNMSCDTLDLGRPWRAIHKYIKKEKPQFLQWER